MGTKKPSVGKTKSVSQGRMVDKSASSTPQAHVQMPVSPGDFRAPTAGGGSAANGAVSHMQACTNCSADARCRRRDFSEQAWALLLAWQEIEAEVVDQAICDDCYDELREVLIDRAAELSGDTPAVTGVRVTVPTREAEGGDAKSAQRPGVKVGNRRTTKLAS